MGKQSKRPGRLTKEEKREKNAEEIAAKTKELQDLEKRMQILHVQSLKIKQNIQAVSKRKHAAIACAAGLQHYDKENTKLFRAVGRAFIHRERDDVEMDLEKSITDATAQLPKLSITQVQFEQKLASETQQVAQLKMDFVKLGVESY